MPARDWSPPDSGICLPGNSCLPPRQEPLAVIGLACRFAGDASDSQKLWQMLLEQRSAAGPVPKSRFDANSYYHPDPDHGGTSAAKGGYFLEGDIHALDTSLFNLTASEVASMDPQQKLLLENVFHALENAGLSLDKMAGSRTSVFIGASNNDHLALANTDMEMLQKHRATGTSPSILANRVSWFYDLRGTSQTIDTACSSSLVAFHQACTDVQSGQTDMSIVSGVNLIEHPASSMQLSTLGVLSPDGRCFSFDHRANGYGRGEGVGTVIVKSLSAALRDGDTVRAIVRGTGSNQDGKTPGMSLPSPEAQEALIRQVYASADLDMRDTSYIEAHGTGTPVGDPLEVQAISNAFQIAEREKPLYIGSVKANLGHLEGGAGIAGLIKVILMLEAQIIPGLANFEHLNPKLQGRSNLAFQTNPTIWPEHDLIRRASINSFGFGGTNSHAVLEAADNFLNGLVQWQSSESDLSTTPTPPHEKNGIKDDYDLAQPIELMRTLESIGQKTPLDLELDQKDVTDISNALVFIFSASDQPGLVRNCKALKEHLDPLVRSKDNSSQARYLTDLAYTLSRHRSGLRWKTFLIANSMEELLRGLDIDSPPAFRAKSDAYRLGFVFTGQGAQWSKMGSSLLVYPSFRKSVKEASLFLSGLGCPYNVREIFENGSEDINHPLLSQTMCTVLQVALVDLLASWNVFPCVTVGHSSGEICAAYSAKRLTRQAAWKIAYYRGLVSVTLHERDRGGMLAVGASIDTVVEQMKALEHEFQHPPEIGCFNSPKNVTVTGDRVELQKLQLALNQNNIFNRMLPVKVPYHSQQMQALSAEYESLLGDLSQGEKLASPQEVRMVSSLTGSTVVKRKLDDASYWVDNLVSPVRFSDALLSSCLTSLSAEGAPTACVDGLVELGPHSTMRSAIREGLGSFSNLKAIEYSHAITRKEASNRSLLGMVATLNSRGYPVDIDRVNQSCQPHLHSSKMVPNLPSYSFLHDKSSRTETRLIKNLRFPRHERHELLGSPVVDWNDYEPKWRNFLRTSEMPWTSHNQLSGNNIYPGVASLIMAMEAASRLIDAPVKPCGYRVRNVSYKAALMIPETKEGIEISFSMRRTNDVSDGHQPWYEFYMRSHDSERDCWVEHTSGLVRVESETQQNDVGDAALNLWNDLSQKSWTTAHERCTQALDVLDYYRNLESFGVLFGPTMQNLTKMAISESEEDIFGEVRVPSLTEEMASGHAKPLIIHPTTMESLAQILLPICASRESPLGSELLTTFTEEIWVSASIDSQPGNMFQARAWSTPRGSSKWRADMDVWNATQERQITATGMMLSALSQNKEVSADYSACYKVSARLSTDLLVSAVDFQTLHQDILKPKDTAHIEQMELLSASFISEALNKLKPSPEAVMPQHQKFYNWMRGMASAVEAGSVPLVHPTALSNLNQDRETREKLQDNLVAYSRRGAALGEVGRRLASLLTGEEDVLSFCHLLDGARQEAPWGNIKPLFSQYLVALGQNHSNIKVLELGAGAGDATKQVLEALGTSISRYHFTDASDVLFEEVQLKLNNWSQKMEYSVLDLESDETDDRVQAGSYDVVVAAHGLETPDAQAKLNRIRRLLKPGGKMLLIESVNPNLMAFPISFGIMPQWWEQAHLQEQELDILLSQSGFSQDSLLFHDTDEEHAREMTLFVSTATDSEAKPNGESNGHNRKCFVVYPGPEGIARDVGSLLESELANAAGLEVTAVDVQHLREHDLQDSICLTLLGLDAFNLSTISPNDYDSLKYMVQTCRDLIWITDDTPSNPLASMAIGMIRTARYERHFEDVNLITLGFGSPQPAPGLMSEVVGRLFCSSFEGPHALEGNGEYTFQNGVFWINRLHAATNVNQFLESRFAPQPSTEPLGVNLDKPLKLEMKQPGDLHRFEFALDSSQGIPLLDDQVQIQVESWGLGSIGTTSTVGKDTENILGREATGRIARVGAAVKHLAAGDRVMTFNPSAALGTSLVAPSMSTQVIPETADFTQAAGIPFCFCTAFYSLYEVARLQQGETILIHSAASGVGQAAVQLAQLAKAEILAMVWTLEEKNILTKEYDLEDHQIFYGGNGTVQAVIDAATKGRGVDVVLRTRANVASDAASDAAWRCMAPFGRFVDLVTHENSFRTTLDMLPFSRAAMYASIDIVKMAQEKPERVWALLQETAVLYQKEQIKCPQPLMQFNFSEIESAVAHAGQGNVLGAAVLAPRSEDMVPKRPSPLPAYCFPDNVSYVLAGGLGGLGRSIARWMASRGARHFIFLSRSGARESAASFVQELRQQGCSVEIGACDISNLDTLTKTLDSYTSRMPPIKGCFQCSMVLRDSMLSNMSHAQFVDCITPKVQGSSNLAQALPRDLDFLLLLSSSSAIIGNRGQANYSAANMYMDTLSESLVRDGFPAISLNLGSVLSAGWLAENKDSKLSGALSHLTTSEEELLALIEYHIDPRYNAAGSVESCHTVTGLRNAAYFSRLGIPQPEFFEYPLFSQLRTLPPAAEGTGRNPDSDSTIKEQLQSPETDPGTIAERISGAIARKLSAMMSIPEEDFEYNRPLTSYGVDSLVTLDFRGWIATTFSATVSVLDLLNGNSIDGLSRKIAESMGLRLQ